MLVVLERGDLGLRRRVVDAAPDLAIVRLKVLQVEGGLALLALEAELVPALVGRSDLEKRRKRDVVRFCDSLFLTNQKAAKSIAHNHNRTQQTTIAN